MTTPSTPRKAGPFNGNGVAVSFPFTFKIFAASDVKVAIANSAGVETVLAEGTDYTVTPNADQDATPGGTVTYPISGSPLPVGSVLSVIGDLDYDQPLDLPSGGNFSPIALENQLDRTVMQVQQLKEQVDRSAKLPQTSAADAESLVADIIRLADSADNLDTVAGSITGVNTTATNIADVNTVAGSITNVNATGGSIANVNTVATNIASVNTNAANISAIQGAAANAVTATTKAAEAASSASEAFWYLQAYRATSYGALAADPVVDPNGNPPTVGDEYFNTSMNLLKRFNGVTWQASDIATADLAAPGGSALVGFQQSGTGAVAATVQSKLRERVSVKDFGAKGDWNGTTGTDDTAAFNAAITATPEYGTLVIPDGKYLIRGVVLVTNKNINIECSGTIYLTDEVNSRIGFENTEVLTFPGTSLSVLPKIGDYTLQWTSAPAGVDDASKYFFVLSSTEEEITRVGYEHYTPYTKNEAGDITNWGWLLRAPIKLDYTDASKLTVRLYKKRDPVTVKGLRVVMANTINASSKLNRLILRGLSNVNFENLIVDSTAVNVAGIAVSIEFCVGLSFTNSTCVGPSAAGDTYAFLNSTSAFLTFKNCEYRNPYNAALEVERGYAARHGANITFDGCRFNGVDDHYGHDYLIENMTFNRRGVSFAGGNMTIRNCQHVGFSGLFEIRSDAPYAYGTLTIDNCMVDGADFLIRCANDSDPLGRPTKVRYFDNIIIKNTVLNWRKQADALQFYHRHEAQGHVFQKTKLLRLKDVVFNKLFAHIECAFKGKISEAGLPNWAERAEFIDVDFRLIVTKTTGSYPETASVAIREFLVDELYVRNFKNFLPYGNLTIQKITAVDSYIGGDPGGDVFMPAGICDFKSCVIDKIIQVNSASTSVFTFVDCTFGTSVYGSGTIGLELKNRTAYLSRNKSTPAINVTNVPPGGLEYYVNPTYYKDGVLGGSAIYDPPSLADGAGATTTVTVTGAALGDAVTAASFSLDLQGVMLTAWVSAVNTVSVRLQNETGATVDLASGTLRVRVAKLG